MNTRRDGPVVTSWFAPGRINLIGEHTDYNDGFVLPFALAVGCTATVSQAAQDWSVRSAQEPEPVVVRRSGLAGADAVPEWTRYVLGALWLLTDRVIDVPPLEITVDSDVPTGAGLSSSAALVCSVVRAVDDHLGLDLDDDAVFALTRDVENDAVGAPTGGMDQLVEPARRGRSRAAVRHAEPRHAPRPARPRRTRPVRPRRRHQGAAQALRRRVRRTAAGLRGGRPDPRGPRAARRVGRGPRRRARTARRRRAASLRPPRGDRGRARPRRRPPAGRGPAARHRRGTDRLAPLDARRLPDHRARGRHGGRRAAVGRRARRADDRRRVRRLRDRAAARGRRRGGGRRRTPCLRRRGLRRAVALHRFGRGRRRRVCLFQ